MTQVAEKRKKQHHPFLWFFLAIQGVFVLWLVVGVAGANPQGSSEEAGTAIGAALIVTLWAVVDFILGVSYGIYKLATRK